MKVKEINFTCHTQCIIYGQLTLLYSKINKQTFFPWTVKENELMQKRISSLNKHINIKLLDGHIEYFI